MTTINKDLASGAIFLAIGLYFLIYSLVDLRLGSALVMGPGYFPALVGVIVAGLGAAIMVKGLAAAPTPLGPVSVRGILLVTLGIVFFAFTLRRLGLVPSLFGAIYIAAVATSRNSPLVAAAIAAVLTALTTGLFVYVLGLPLPMLGPWLGGY